jgi:NADH-quinone oxidoreductase subunit M
MLRAEFLLTATVFLPVVWGLALLLFDRRAVTVMRYWSVLGTGLTLLLAVLLGQQYVAVTGAETAAANVPVISSPDARDAVTVENRSALVLPLQLSVPWIPAWNVQFSLGVDGLSLPLVLLTAVISFLAMLASWSVKEQLRGYLFLMLLLETGMLGVFLAVDFFLFYVFWEVMLLPMYFLIGIWGGPRREYAAIKFFLYTLVGGVLLLIPLLMCYVGSDGSFDLLQLAQIGQGQHPTLQFSPTFQTVAFVLLFLGFAIKLPVVPFHTWLPDAHVEAPTPVSMILAGVLLKMGGYGLLRVAFPICPLGAQACATLLATMGVVSILYGAFAALAQTDFKQLVAYSSVSHMGYVLLGMSAWKLGTGQDDAVFYWQMGLNAAVFQMVAHGVSSAGMFFAVGILYDRVHHRDLNQFGGIARLMPEYTAIATGLFFAGLGLPGLCGFIGEVFAVLSAWHFNPRLAVLAAVGVILTAGYILWTIQRVYFGPAYRGLHADQLVELNSRERFIGYSLLSLAIVLGVYPRLVFDVSQPTLGVLAAGLDEAQRAEPRVPERPLGRHGARDSLPTLVEIEHRPLSDDRPAVGEGRWLSEAQP